jgi:hypothetical protein
VPPKSQLGPNASYTSIGLRPEEYEAAHEIEKVRRGKNPRTSLNSILIDALWDLLKKETGKTWDQIRAALPEHRRTLEPPDIPLANVTQMPKRGKKKR